MHKRRQGRLRYAFNTETTPDQNMEKDFVNKDMLESIGEAIRIMARLRTPGGCPWDAAQTRETLLKNLLEETYEFINAVESGDLTNMREELGDLLLQVIFHAQIAAERSEFDIGDVARDLCEKLIRRHPHVFGDIKANNQQEALASWNSAKRGEGEKSVSLIEAPHGMPALIRARKVVEKAGNVGFEWLDVRAAIDKLDEEVNELRKAVEERDERHIREELGDVLFMTACVARYVKECPELALQSSIDKFIERFRYIEKKLAEEGMKPEDATLEKMDGYWDEAKEQERDSSGKHGD